MNTRRDFLKASAFASFYIASSRAFGAFSGHGLNGLPTVGFIGMGPQGRGLLGNFLRCKCVVTCICDCDRVRCNDSCERARKHYRSNPHLGIPESAVRAEYDFRKVIEDPTIDLVCIATPDHWHAYMVVEAMKHGKDVYCEKPLTYSVDEARVIEAVARQTGRLLQTGSMQRSGHEFWAACTMARNGVIGDIKYAENNFGGPSRPRRDYEDPKKAESEGAPNPDVDFEMWLGAAPKVPYSDRLAPRGVHNFFPDFWRRDDYFGSGACGDWGAHHMDIMHWGTGHDGTGPVKVIASAENPSGDWKDGGRRQRGATLVYADGFKAKHIGDTNWGTVFYGTKGILCVDRGRFALWTGENTVLDDNKEVRKALSKGTFDGLRKVAYHNGRNAFNFDIWGEEFGKDAGHAIRLAEERVGFKVKDLPNQLYRSEDHVRSFIECCVARKAPICDHTVGPWSSVLCQLLNMSYVHATGFDWDPKGMTFANGTGDRSWLARTELRPDTGKFAVRA